MFVKKVRVLRVFRLAMTSTSRNGPMPMEGSIRLSLRSLLPSEYREEFFLLPVAFLEVEWDIMTRLNLDWVPLGFEGQPNFEGT